MSTTKIPVSTSPAATRIRRFSRSVPAGGAGSLTLLLILLVLVIVSGVTSTGFFTVENARAILVAAASTGIAAIGVAFVTLSGNFFSLSVAQTAEACGVVLALLIRAGWAVIPAMVVMFAVAAVIGAIQGVVIARGANPIIVTLAAGGVLAGFTGIISGDNGVTIGQTSLNWFGNGRILGFPVVIYVFIALALVSAVFLSRHRDGRALMLIGSNRNTAAATGLGVGRATVIAFVLASLSCAIVAAQSVFQFKYANGTSFDSLTFGALAAVLVGGVALQGGEGSPIGAGLGALFMSTLADFMLLHQLSYGAQLAVQGLAVVLAVSAFHLMRRRSGSR